MDERTLTALQGSIAKWEAIAAGTGKDDGTANCPLCEEFYGDDCVECPVKERTGQRACAGSPYDEWTESIGIFKVGGRADTPARVALAIAEVDFLRSLLPSQQSAEGGGNG